MSTDYEATDGDDRISIVVKTVQNDSFQLSLLRITSILRLKEIISETVSISIDRQRLIYRGIVLQDPLTINDYQIASGHTIHMVARPENYRELQRHAELTSSIPTRSVPDITTPLLLGSSRSTGNSYQTNNSQQIPSTDNSATTDNSLEHIRQGLLSLHTIYSTMNTRDLSSSQSLISLSDSTFENSTRKYFMGQWVDVKDTVNQWLEATILDINEPDGQVYVHYNGWPSRWDEWISVDSARLAPFRSRTRHVPNSNQTLPNPNTSMQNAPITGVDDIRTLLPEIAYQFRSAYPILNRAAVLAQQSETISGIVENESDDINEDYTDAPVILSVNRSSANSRLSRPDRNVARNMPWSNQSSVNDSDTGGLLHQSDVQVASSGSNDVEAELRFVCRELCPVFDRLGRVLTDLSPHLQRYAAGPTSSSTAAQMPPSTQSSLPTHQSNGMSDAGAVAGNSSGSLNTLTNLQNDLRSLQGIDANDSIMSSLQSLENIMSQLLRPRTPSPPPESSFRSPMNVSNQLSVPSGTNLMRSVSGTTGLDIRIAIITPQRTLQSSHQTAANTSSHATTPLVQSSSNSSDISPSPHSSVTGVTPIASTPLSPAIVTSNPFIPASVVQIIPHSPAELNTNERTDQNDVIPTLSAAQFPVRRRLSTSSLNNSNTVENTIASANQGINMLDSPSSAPISLTSVASNSSNSAVIPRTPTSASGSASPLSTVSSRRGHNTGVVRLLHNNKTDSVDNECSISTSAFEENESVLLDINRDKNYVSTDTSNSEIGDTVQYSSSYVSEGMESDESDPELHVHGINLETNTLIANSFHTNYCLSADNKDQIVTESSISNCIVDNMLIGQDLTFVANKKSDANDSLVSTLSANLFRTSSHFDTIRDFGEDWYVEHDSTFEYDFNSRCSLSSLPVSSSSIDSDEEDMKLILDDLDLNFTSL